MGKIIDLTGQRFGRLVVVGVAERIQHKWKLRFAWKCICDCGNTKVTLSHSLTRGLCTSCGCFKVEMTRKRNRKAPGHSGLTNLIGAYKKSAIARGHEFTLSLQDFSHLTKMACHYCGAQPLLRARAEKKNSTIEGRIHSEYPYNGLDRVDNDRGYTHENCVPCCIRCNYAKHTSTYADFIGWARRISAYQDNKDAINWQSDNKGIHQ